jgi:hypothetical protein
MAHGDQSNMPSRAALIAIAEGLLSSPADLLPANRHRMIQIGLMGMPDYSVVSYEAENVDRTHASGRVFQTALVSQFRRSE